MQLSPLLGRSRRDRRVRRAQRALGALALSGGLPLATAAQPPAPRAPADSGSQVTVLASALDGLVTDATNRPLLGAVVVATDHPGYVLSTEKGTFHLGGLPPGRRQFEVRRVGYLPAVFELDVPPATVVHIHARLEPSPITLRTMLIEGRSRPLGLWHAGFYDRAASEAMGYFYPPEEIVRRNLTSMTDLLAEIPSLVIESRNGHVIPYGRGTGTGRCKLNVWVDNMLTAAADDGLDAIAPGWIVRAVEIYPTVTATPKRYVRPNNLCGAILIWTKGIVY
ncbi:MAG TPA: carboxypeptidase-like regulatory domain-containing protein [Gemmatimonadaceae bacterium]|nr:carboxypeptidase-like regulatory domain-containing protein [Gemmatimonadaceae bacterium]